MWPKRKRLVVFCPFARRSNVVAIQGWFDRTIRCTSCGADVMLKDENKLNHLIQREL